MPTRRDAAAFLPLKSDVFQILLTLLDADAHGYHLIKAAASAAPMGQLQPGAVYRLLRRMLDEKLIEEVDPPKTAAGDSRRRYYRITAFGRRVVRAEGERLGAVLDTLRRHRLAPARGR